MQAATLVVIASLAILLPSCATTPHESAPPQEGGRRAPDRGEWRGNLNLIAAGRSLDEDYWDPIEDHFAIGIEFDMRPEDFALGFEIGTSFSYGEEDNVQDPMMVLPPIDVDAAIGEIYFGPRVTIDNDNGITPYVGGGVTFMSVTYEGSIGSVTVDDDDTSVAGYLHGGILFQLGHSLNLGADVRGVFGSDIELFGVEGDADYVQVGLVLGATF